MLERLISAWYFMQARRQSGAGNHGKAIKYIEKISRRRPLRAFEEAYRTALVFMDMQLPEAEASFIKLRERTKNLSDATNQYLYHYCNAILLDIDGDEQGRRESIEIANNLDVDRIVKDCLPLTLEKSRSFIVLPDSSSVH